MIKSYDMTDRITTLHRGWLWGALLLLGALGALFLLAPDVLLDQLEIEGTERAKGVFRGASSVLLAEAVLIALALRSGQWSQTRYVTYLLAIHFTFDTLIRIAVFTIGESSSLVAAIPQAVLAAGFALEIYRRQGQRVNTAVPSA